MADLRDQEVVYSGKRFVVRDGELVEAWEVYRNGEPFLGKGGKLTGYIWGMDPHFALEEAIRSAHLILDIVNDAVSSLLVENFSVGLLIGLGTHIFDNLPDFWSLTRSDVLALIDAFQSGEVSHG